MKNFFSLNLSPEVPAYLIDLMNDNNAEIKNVCNNTLDIIGVSGIIRSRLYGDFLSLPVGCSPICSPISSRNMMKSGGKRFRERSSATITTSGWRWLRIGRLMSLILTCTIMTGQICSTMQVCTHC